MTITYYVGLDVHKETVSIAYALAGSRDDATYHGHCAGSIDAVTKALQKLAEKLQVKSQELKVCYETGPTGFVIARHLIKKGLECVLMSPSKTERKPGDKIKTDKKDACNITRLFRNGDITPVRIPPGLDEAVRDVCRARTDATDDLIRAISTSKCTQPYQRGRASIKGLMLKLRKCISTGRLIGIAVSRLIQLLCSVVDDVDDHHSRQSSISSVRFGWRHANITSSRAS